MDETSIEAVKTNVAFLKALLADERVQRGEQHIHTVQDGLRGVVGAGEEGAG